MAQCPTCGTVWHGSTEVCQECGTALTAPAAGEADGPPGPGPVAAAADPATRPEPLSAREGSTVATLALLKGGAPSGEQFTLGTRSLIGRFDPETGPVDVDLAPLPDAHYVGRRHAEIWRSDDGQWFVKDLGTKNRTFLRRSGEADFSPIAEETPIGDADRIAFANAQFEFRTSGGPSRLDLP